MNVLTKSPSLLTLPFSSLAQFSLCQKARTLLILFAFSIPVTSTQAIPLAPEQLNKVKEKVLIKLVSYEAYSKYVLSIEGVTCAAQKDQDPMKFAAYGRYCEMYPDFKKKDSSMRKEVIPGLADALKASSMSQKEMVIIGRMMNVLSNASVSFEMVSKNMEAMKAKGVAPADAGIDLKSAVNDAVARYKSTN